MNDKISVIVPIYNVEKYLLKCIESIISQTYTNLEIILVNDGSPDNSRIICDEYSKKDHRIKVINKENGGLSDARNVGLDIATGDFISFIDSDDYIHEGYYETLIDLIIKFDADIAQCEFLKVYDKATYNFDIEISSVEPKITVLSNEDALKNLYNEHYVNTVVVWNKLYKRKLFKQIRFPKGKVHEDEYTTYKVLFDTKKVVCTSKPMNYYLQRSDSIMGNIKGEGFNVKLLDKLGAYQEQIIFYGDKKLLDLENKAKISFESLLIGSMIDVSKSKLDNKNEIFHYLVNFYKKNNFINSDNMTISLKKKSRILLFKYSPEFCIKILCGLMYFKMKLAYTLRYKFLRPKGRKNTNNSKSFV